MGVTVLEADAYLAAKVNELNDVLKIAGTKYTYRISRRKGTQEDKRITLQYVEELIKAGAEHVRIWNLQPAAVWEAYKHFGDFDNHRECILLRQAVSAFLKKFNQCKPQLATCLTRIPDAKTQELYARTRHENHAERQVQPQV